MLSLELRVESGKVVESLVFKVVESGKFFKNEASQGAKCRAVIKI